MQLVDLPLPVVAAPSGRALLRAAVWALPFAALALAAAHGAGELWLFQQPMALFGLGLIAAAELFRTVVCALRPGARPSPLRALRAPLLLSVLPLGVALFGIEDVSLAVRDGVPLMTHHVVLLGVLLYGGISLLELRERALPEAMPQQPVALPATSPAPERLAA